MTTTPVPLNPTALFGNPLWRTTVTNPLANAAIPATIASATQVYKISSTQSAELLLPLTASALSAFITSVQVAITTAAPFGAPPNQPALVSLGVKNSNGVYQYTQAQALTIGAVNTLQFYTKPDGTTWTPADIVNTVVKIIDPSTSGIGTLASLAVSTISTSIPTATITPQTIITSSTPQISWTYADADLALQSGYQVQIVDASNTSSVIYDSGFITGLDTTYTIPAVVTASNNLVAFTPSSGIIGGKWVGSATNNNGDIVYMVSNQGSIVRSADYGATFRVLTSISGGAWTDIATDSTGTIVYVCANGGSIYRSTDSGNTFAVVAGTNGLGWGGIATNSTGTNVYAYVNVGSIYRSTNSGATFTAVAGTSGFIWYGIATNSTGTNVYACANAGSIYRSTDSGATFTVVVGTSFSDLSGITTNSTGTNVYACTSLGSIYRSTDSGATFAIVAGTPAGNLYGITTNSTGTNVYVCGGIGGIGNIYRSTDSGATFATVAGTGDLLTSVATNSTGTNVYVCANGGSIYRSTDSGATFAIVAGTGNFFTFIATNSTGTIVYSCAPQTGIYRSTDSGATFTAVAGTSGLDWSGIATNSTGTNVYACANGDSIYRSTDSGATFTAVAGTSGFTWYGIATNSSGSNVYAVSYGDAIYRSINYGVTFTAVTGTSGLAWYGITTNSSGSNVYAYVDNGSIYRSTDSGATFTAVAGTAGLNWGGITTNSSGSNVYAFVQNGGSIYRSTDSGATFTVVAGTNVLGWSGIATNSTGTNVYACANGDSIYRSTDSGATFTAVAGTSGFIWYGIATNSTGTNVYAITANGGIFLAIFISFLYRVRATKNVNGVNNYTSYSGFTPSSISYADTPPSLSVSLVNREPVITINLPNVTTLGYTLRNISVQRKWSGGWGVVRNGTIANVGLTASTIQFADVENPTNQMVTYRVRAIYYDASGNEYVGNPVSVSLFIPALPSWWIQKTDGVDSGIAINALLSGKLPVSRNRPQTHLYPLGSRFPITVSGTVQGYDGEITIYFDNQPAFTAFLPYLDYIGKLMITAPNGAYKYITLDKDDVVNALGRGTDILREMKLAYTEEDSGLGFNETVVNEF